MRDALRSTFRERTWLRRRQMRRLRPSGDSDLVAVRAEMLTLTRAEHEPTHERSEGLVSPAPVLVR